MDIKKKSSIELMNMYAEILAELNSRNVVRTYNSPVGDYAEWLVAEKLGFVLEHNNRFALSSEKPVGARCSVGTKQRAERDQEL